MRDFKHTACLVLADGTIFRGYSHGLPGYCCGEVVFNTSTTGYQEVITDPSYARQLIAFTSPHIGNTGINTDDFESSRIWASGLIFKELTPVASHWRAKESLPEYLIRHNIPYIFGIDTRHLTIHIREKGPQTGCIVTGHDGMEWPIKNVIPASSALHPVSRTEGSGRLSIYVYDFGVKYSLLRHLVELGCQVKVVPSTLSYTDLIKEKPDGVVFSSGPGDPASFDHALINLQGLLRYRIPLLGICLGCQLLGIACGAKTSKMHCGHRGSNHPVYSMRSQRVMITSQNHGYVIDDNELPAMLQVTHRSLIDGTIEGIRHREAPALGFQAHPEAGPGPLDAFEIFHDFIGLITHAKT